MSNKFPVVIIRANDNCFLDVLRSFAMVNVITIPIVFSWEGANRWISEDSLFYKNEVHICNPAEDEILAKTQVLEFGKKLKEKYKTKCLLISTSDTALVFVQKYFEELSQYFLQMGKREFNGSCYEQMSKDIFASTMQEHNIAIPQTIKVRCKDEINNAVENIQYPCIYKPTIKDLTSSFQNTHNMKKAIECKTKEELRENLKNEIKNGYELVVQRKIQIESIDDEVSCYIYRDTDKKIRMISCQHKLFEHPHPYGTGVVSEQIFVKDLSEIAKKVIEAMDWYGFIGIEFMFDSATQEWVVIEANIRPWLSIYFQSALGFNYLYELYKDVYKCNINFEKTRIPESNGIIRINLSGFLKKLISENNNLTSALVIIKDFINLNMGKIIFSYSIYDDPEPGKIEIEELKKKYGNNELFDEILKMEYENNYIFKKESKVI